MATHCLSCCPSSPLEKENTSPTSLHSPTSPCWVQDGQLLVEALKKEIGCCTSQLSMGDEAVQYKGAEMLYSSMMKIWSLEAGELPRNAADVACDEIRLNGGLSRMLHLLCTTGNKQLTISLAKAMEQVMVSGNRSYIANHEHFNQVVQVVSQKDCPELMQFGTGILENLFKESTRTCLTLIANGGLEGVVHGCRFSDPLVLQHCAAALANCAMYGCRQCQEHMIKKNVDHWLFPLAFSSDNIVKYYALLGIAMLASNGQLADRVAQSETLELVLPFLYSQDPDQFAASCPSHAHGRSAGWLKRLKPLLVCECEEARSMAAFHFAMEVGIKRKQGKLDVFRDIDIAGHLQMAAKKGSKLIACLCCKALTIMDAPLPTYQSWNVLKWRSDQVQAWATDMGLEDFALSFTQHMVNGNILVDLTIDDLLEMGLRSRVQGKWVMEQIGKLRRRADVSALDRGNISKFLADTHKDLTIYQVDFARRGITADFLPHLTKDMLIEIGVYSAVDRARILHQVSELCGYDMADTGSNTAVLPLSPRYRKKYDVFISYRRDSGSQLASLLKVHLQVRGLSTFLDVTSLGGGKFDDALLTTIGQCSNMVVILSRDCLRRCIGDQRIEDWMHKELVWALEKSVNIVPLVDPYFNWPTQEQLPIDLQPLCLLNAVTWSHEYQEASVERLVKFLNLPPLLRMKSMTKALSRED